MKKAILSAIILIACGLNANAQVFKLGIKGGPNFANFSGGVDGINYSSRTSFHIGGAAELGITGKFAIAPEVLYSSQGADVDGFGDFNLDYVAVPVLARIYILSDKLSIDVGPQFSFLVDEADEAFNNESFDFAVAGGATLNVTKSIFVQARYTVGLTDASKDAEVKNSVFQVSVGYYFF
ncbi:MAG TPA: porin family protein [Flavobacterium sp.]|nr:porin family protein [Flavobacterium sp.]